MENNSQLIAQCEANGEGQDNKPSFDWRIGFLRPCSFHTFSLSMISLLISINRFFCPFTLINADLCMFYTLFRSCWCKITYFLWIPQQKSLKLFALS